MPLPKLTHQPSLIALLVIAAFASTARAESNVDALRPSGQFSLPTFVAAPTPPMGWNPWNAFGTEVSEAKIMGVARKLKTSGLANAGYRYVNIDDGWWLKRDADGRIQVRTSMFPSAAGPNGKTSLRPFVERLHGMGLKAGIYTDSGRNACSQLTQPPPRNLPVGTQAEREIGSFGFQAQDMGLIFGEWGFDYIKVDACGLSGYASEMPYVRNGTYRALGPYIVMQDKVRTDAAKVEAVYADLRKAIDTVRPDGNYVLSLCVWGEANVADWGKGYGNLWRTSGDITADWKSMLNNFDSAASRPLYAGPGRWNDPDMLEIGRGEFDARHPVEARTHMSLWAIINAPLIIGADLTKLPSSVLAILGNRDVIAINQDAAGNQGVIVARTDETEIIAKSLAQTGAKAVALVNRGTKPQTLSVALARLNLDQSAVATMRDLWSGQERPVDGGTITVQLKPHETRLLLVKGQPELKDGLYLGEMPARINVAVDGRAAIARVDGATWVPAQVNATPSGQPLVVGGERHDNGLGVLGNSRLEVRLDKAFRRFHSTAGISGGVGSAVTYRVYGDGKLLFEKRSAQPEVIDVPVQGVGTLELVAQLDGDHDNPTTVAWADARLVR